MAQHAIDGIPKNCQILHVEQEVTGDDTTALQCVLNADVERVQLMQEEAQLGQLLVNYCTHQLFTCLSLLMCSSLLGDSPSFFVFC